MHPVLLQLSFGYPQPSQAQAALPFTRVEAVLQSLGGKVSALYPRFGYYEVAAVALLPRSLSLPDLLAALSRKCPLAAVDATLLLTDTEAAYLSHPSGTKLSSRSSAARPGYGSSVEIHHALVPRPRPLLWPAECS